MKNYHSIETGILGNPKFHLNSLESKSTSGFQQPFKADGAATDYSGSIDDDVTSES